MNDLAGLLVCGWRPRIPGNEMKRGVGMSSLLQVVHGRQSFVVAVLQLKKLSHLMHSA